MQREQILKKEKKKKKRKTLSTFACEFNVSRRDLGRVQSNLQRFTYSFLDALLRADLLLSQFYHGDIS